MKRYCTNERDAHLVLTGILVAAGEGVGPCPVLLLVPELALVATAVCVLYLARPSLPLPLPGHLDREYIKMALVCTVIYTLSPLR